jgi:hypothetical protein
MQRNIATQYSIVLPLIAKGEPTIIKTIIIIITTSQHTAAAKQHIDLS